MCLPTIVVDTALFLLLDPVRFGYDNLRRDWFLFRKQMYKRLGSKGRPDSERSNRRTLDNLRDQAIGSSPPRHQYPAIVDPISVLRKLAALVDLTRTRR